MAKHSRIAVIDCQSTGIAGDMFVAALIDLGADQERVKEAMESVRPFLKGCEDLRVSFEEVLRQGIQGKKIDILYRESVKHRKGQELIRAVEETLHTIGASKRASEIANKTIRTIVETEAKIHGRDVKNVYLHEAGMAETASEIIGASVALESLNLLEETSFFSTSVAVGGGTFTFSHGVVSSPAPATLEILRSSSFMIHGGPFEAELTTPTGASLLVNIAEKSLRFYPPMKVEAVGYGAGSKDFPGLPNILRVLVGKALGKGFLIEEVCILETNVDDASGEVIGHLFERLMAEGAKDVSIVPMFTKKSRPGYIVKVMVDIDEAERFSKIIFEETGTLGIRIQPCSRYVLQREVMNVHIELDGVEAKVRVKVSRDTEGNILQIKPEFEDVKLLAQRVGRPLREVMNETLRRVERLIKKT